MRKLRCAVYTRKSSEEDRTGDQHDAFCIAAWLVLADGNGSLAGFLQPKLSAAEQAVGLMEGWILGVTGELDLSGPGDAAKGGAANRSLH